MVKQTMKIPQFKDHLKEASVSAGAMSGAIENIRKVMQNQLSRLEGSEVKVVRYYGYDFINDGGDLTGIKFLLSKKNTPFAAFRLNWKSANAGDSSQIESVDLWINKWRNMVKTSDQSETDQPELNLKIPGVSFAAIIGNVGSGKTPEKVGLIHLLLKKKMVKEIDVAWEGQAYEDVFRTSLSDSILFENYDQIYVNEAKRKESSIKKQPSNSSIVVTKAPKYSENDVRYILDVKELMKSDPLIRKEQFKSKIKALFQPNGYDLLFCLGPAGTGKSFQVEDVVKNVMGLREGIDFDISAGSIEFPSLTAFLWKYRKFGQLAIFDDCDNALQPETQNMWKNAFQDKMDARNVGYKTNDRYDPDDFVKAVKDNLEQAVVDVKGDESQSILSELYSDPRWIEFMKRLDGGVTPETRDPKTAKVNYLKYSGRAELQKAFVKYLYPIFEDHLEIELSAFEKHTSKAIRFFSNCASWFLSNGKDGIPDQFPIRNKTIVITNQAASLMSEPVKQRAFLAKLYYSVDDIFKIVKSLYIDDPDARNKMIASIDSSFGEEIASLGEENPNPIRVRELENARKRLPAFLTDKNWTEGFLEVLDFARSRFTKEQLTKMPTSNVMYSEIETQTTFSIRVCNKAFRLWVTGKMGGVDENLWKQDLIEKLK